MGFIFDRLLELYCKLFNHKVHIIFHSLAYDGKFPDHIYQTIRNNAYYGPEEIIASCKKLEEENYLESNKAKIICSECVRCGMVFVEIEVLDEVENDLSLELNECSC